MWASTFATRPLLVFAARYRHAVDACPPHCVHGVDTVRQPRDRHHGHRRTSRSLLPRRTANRRKEAAGGTPGRPRPPRPPYGYSGAHERARARRAQGAGLQGLARRRSDFDRFHQRTRTREPDFVYEVVRILMSLMAWIFFRVRGYHPERVPAVGPVILAPNHFSFLDHFFLGVALRRKVHFMAKSQLFKPPMEWIYTHGGVFPVRRGVRRRGGVHHRRDGARPRRHDGDVRRGRALAHRRALGEAPARDRPPGAAERRADRPRGDRRLLATCATGSACSSRRSASTTASRSPTNASRRRRATRSRPRPTPSSRRCASSTTRPRAGSAHLSRPRPRRAACRGRAGRSARRRRAPRRRPRSRSSCRR